MIGIDPAIDDTIATLIETINEKLNKTCFYNDRMITFDKSTAFLTKNERFKRAFDKCALNDEDRSRSWLKRSVIPHRCDITGHYVASNPRDSSSLRLG